MQSLKKDCQDKQEMRRLRLSKMIGIEITSLPYSKPELQEVVSMIEEDIGFFGDVNCFNENYIRLLVDKRFIEKNKPKYKEN